MTIPDRLTTFVDTYTKGLKAEDLQRLFTRDTREAYKFFTRGADPEALKALPWHRRSFAIAKLLFVAFTMKVYQAHGLRHGLLLFAIGLMNLFRGIGLVQVTSALPFDVSVPGQLFRQGTWSLFLAFG